MFPGTTIIARSSEHRQTSARVFLPKQADIDKILKILQRKVLKGTHLPVTVEEIEAGYFISPYFKDLYCCDLLGNYC